MLIGDDVEITSVFAKTAGLSDKTGKFSICPAKIFGLSDSCPATIFNLQILMIHIFSFQLFLTSHFWVKKALKQYHLTLKLYFLIVSCYQLKS